MKPRTYFGLALLFPYLLWVICALGVFMLSSAQEISETWNFVLMPLFFYAFGILLWFIPYTVLAIGMWILSRTKSTTALYRLGLIAPIMLFVLMLIEVTLVSLPAESVTDLAKDLPSQLPLLGGFSLIFGYLCVGAALGVFKILRAKSLIAEETPPSLSNDPSHSTPK